MRTQVEKLHAPDAHTIVCFEETIQFPLYGTLDG